MARRQPHCIASIFLGVFLSVLACSVSAFAQCERGDQLGSGTVLKLSQRLGYATVQIVRPNSHGRRVEIEYGDELYIAKFGPDGKAQLDFVLTEATNKFPLNIAEIPPLNCSIAVPDFAKIFRVTLRWREPVMLDLNVVEPGARMGEPGHLNASRPTGDRGNGFGVLDIVGGVPTDGSTSEISYSVAEPAKMAAVGPASFKVAFATRGNQPALPYCDQGTLAAVRFDVITLEAGVATVSKMTTNRARCGEALSESRYLIPIRR